MVCTILNDTYVALLFYSCRSGEVFINLYQTLHTYCYSLNAIVCCSGGSKFLQSLLYPYSSFSVSCIIYNLPWICHYYLIELLFLNMQLKMISISTPALLLSESAPYTVLYLVKSDYCSKLLLDIYPDHIKL